MCHEELHFLQLFGILHEAATKFCHRHMANDSNISLTFHLTVKCWWPSTLYTLIPSLTNLHSRPHQCLFFAGRLSYKKIRLAKDCKTNSGNNIPQCTALKNVPKRGRPSLFPLLTSFLYTECLRFVCTKNINWIF